MKLTEDRIQSTAWPVAVAAVLIVLVLLSMIGCASLGVATPQGPQQQIAYAYSGVTASLNTLAQLTNQGAISSTDAIKANGAILNVKTILDDANEAAASSAPTAVNLLTTATKALAQVTAYLTCKQQKGTTACQLSP